MKFIKSGILALKLIVPWYANKQYIFTANEISAKLQ